MDRPNFILERHPFIGWLALTMLFGTTLAGMGLDVAEPDAAIYAEIAREMAANKSWWALTWRDAPFLDKPHFPFWLTALSFEVFGVSNFAYRLPALIFAVLALCYTYALAAHWVGRTVALLSVLVLAASTHFMASNIDVRAEAYLTGLTVCAFYYLVRYLEGRRWIDLMWLSIGAGFLLATKGLFTVLPLFFGALGGLVLHRDWRKLWDWRWLVGAGLTLLCTTPVMLAYWWQFDAHPEQVVNLGTKGQATGVSGIRFFWWDSQFGRFFNTGPIRGEGELWFYLHTLIWAFFPWAVIWVGAIVALVRNNKRVRVWHSYCLCASLPTLIVLSLSQFQLPHYVTPLFPFLSIVVAAWLVEAKRLEQLWVHWAQLVLYVVVVACVLLVWVLAKEPEWWNLIAAVVVVAVVFWMYVRPFRSWYMVSHALVMATFLQLVALSEWLPWLYRYQAGSQIAQYIHHNQLTDLPTRVLGVKTEAFDFYLQEVVPRLTSVDQIPLGEQSLLVASADAKKTLEERKIAYTPLQRFDDHGITRFNWQFFRRDTRAEALSSVYLLLIQSNTPLQHSRLGSRPSEMQQRTQMGGGVHQCIQCNC